MLQITRHGSRSPLMTYPNDPYPYYDLNYWPAGVGQLTKYGHQQLYVSGQNYRRRYNGFLPLEYNVNNTLARTNLYDRDFMSAACFLAGLFPPQGYQLWNPKIPWQPIPIWEEPFDVSDYLQLVRVCPSYAVEMVKATKELNDQLLDANRDLLDYLSVNSGINITTIGEIHSIWDALTMQFENGYKLPSWAKSVYPDKMAPLYAEMFYSAVGGTPKMIRLTGGPVIRNVSNMLNSKAAGSMKPAGRLVYLEAAHDFTLQALLAALGITNKMLINTSASMAFELHKPRLAEYHVQVCQSIFIK
ncbi:hypothetical protein AAG570_011064 [Ranatra chinensis]|uniref:acid phosphatase n=1 Tax=Ranatra chinensis TaxID=642074 RepID=A0ABD0YJP2_9HEMI